MTNKLTGRRLDPRHEFEIVSPIHTLAFMGEDPRRSDLDD